MKNADLLLAANTLWVVAHHGGTHGSPVNPLLHRSGATTRDEATAGEARLRRPFVTPPHCAEEAAA
jgi:hypothetical protein